MLIQSGQKIQHLSIKANIKILVYMSYTQAVLPLHVKMSVQTEIMQCDRNNQQKQLQLFCALNKFL